MQDCLNGMFWDVGTLSFDIPYIGDSKKAVFIYQQNRAAITWNAMSTLENNPTTLPQTITILNGYTVGGLDQYEMMQVVNYGKAGKELVRLIRADEFELSEACASHLHNFAGKEDALVWGSFRTGDVGIQGCQYTPPDANNLPELAAKVLSSWRRRLRIRRNEPLPSFFSCPEVNFSMTQTSGQLLL